MIPVENTNKPIPTNTPGLTQLSAFLWRSALSRFNKKIYHSTIDITSECNLACKGCYFALQNKHTSLSDYDMIQFFQTLRKKGVVGTMLLGGEPMLRPNVVQKACEIFPFTEIFTNGTISLDGIAPTLFVISIDGPPDIHDSLRGKGVFDRIKHNLEKTTTKRPIIAHATLYRPIWGKEEKLVHAIASLPRIKHLFFSFANATREEYAQNDYTNVFTVEERKIIVQRLLNLKPKYGRFLLINKRMGAHLIPGTKERSTWDSPETCHTFQTHESYWSDGSVKYQCPYHSHTECKLCGCGGSVLYQAMHSLHLPSIFNVASAFVFPLISQHLLGKQ
jgi:MoaA/NifB/PqqE/SkfB family radical SAM enzyme